MEQLYKETLERLTAELKKQLPRLLSLRTLFLKKHNQSGKGGISLEQNQLHYGLSLKLYFENKAFGPGMSALLRGVETTGSLQGAAQAMNMAYSKAWKMLKESEKAWGFMLTERETGGRDGGGSTLTPQAIRGGIIR